MVNMTSDKRKSYRFSIDGAREVHYCEWKLNVILLCKDNIVLQTFCKQYLPSRQKERENIRAPNSICNYRLSGPSNQTLTILNSRGRTGRKSNLLFKVKNCTWWHSQFLWCFMLPGSNIFVGPTWKIFKQNEKISQGNWQSPIGWLSSCLNSTFRIFRWKSSFQKSDHPLWSKSKYIWTIM